MVPFLALPAGAGGDAHIAGRRRHERGEMHLRLVFADDQRRLHARIHAEDHVGVTDEVVFPEVHPFAVFVAVAMHGDAVTGVAAVGDVHLEWVIGDEDDLRVCVLVERNVLRPHTDDGLAFPFFGECDCRREPSGAVAEGAGGKVDHDPPPGRVEGMLEIPFPAPVKFDLPPDEVFALGEDVELGVFFAARFAVVVHLAGVRVAQFIAKSRGARRHPDPDTADEIDVDSVGSENALWKSVFFHCDLFFCFALLAGCAPCWSLVRSCTLGALPHSLRAQNAPRRRNASQTVLFMSVLFAA